MSESTQHLPDDLKQKFPQIPWQEISGFRNILVHNYLGNIDPETVLKVILRQITPKLPTSAKLPPPITIAWPTPKRPTGGHSGPEC